MEKEGNNSIQQQMKHQKEGRNNNVGIIAKKLNLNRMQLNKIMMDIAERGMDGGCKDNTNLTEGGLEEGNLSYDGHEKEYNDKNSDLREQNSR